MIDLCLHKRIKDDIYYKLEICKNKNVNRNIDLIKKQKQSIVSKTYLDGKNTKRKFYIFL